MDIDEEWEKFVSSGYNCEDDVSSDDDHMSVSILPNDEDFISANISLDLNGEIPKASEIYISTKTKIAYLNTPIELNDTFWKIPIIPYSKPSNGVIKKQIKFNSNSKQELNFIEEQLKKETCYDLQIITRIDNPAGRIKFKDVSKVSIGISKKDITSYRCKKKSAFYNCFVLIIRMKIEDMFKEFHVKVFNTGKLEIPGIQSETIFELLLKQVLEILQPHIDVPLGYRENAKFTVLINSNFNCGFYINREILYDLLKFKYNLQSIYDPCSYPGIQCKFYYNPDVKQQNGSQISEENKHLYKNIMTISFMIFRTGSVLIVGKCDENVLIIIYEFLKIILNNEYKSICQNINLVKNNLLETKNKKKKVRRKNITVEFDTV